MQSDRHRLPFLFDRLLASDPSLVRLRSGARALLTALLCAGLFLPITHAFDLKYKLSLAGIVVPMMSVVALQDPGRRQQQRTMAWIPLVAGATLVIGTLVADNPWLSAALFVLTIFIAFQVRRFGARGAGLGTIAYQSFFYAMLFKNPPEQVLWIPVFVAIGCALAFAVHFWIVPEHPGRMLHSEVRAYRARVAALLHDLARWLDQDDKAGRKRIDAHLAALNAQSLGLDSRLAGFTHAAGQPDGTRLREHVLRVELAVEAIADVVRGLDAADRPALAAPLRELQAGTVRNCHSHLFEMAAWESRLCLPDDARWRLSRAAAVLAGMALWREALPAMRDEQAPPATQAAQAAPGQGTARAGGKAGAPFDDTTRRALQACASALAALLVGRAISPSHWYWAVFAAFVVFTRAGTVGQTLSAGWRQVLASLGGLCLGVLFAELVHGSRELELTLLFVFVGLGFYAFKGMQNVYTVLLTAMLAMLYELMGMNSPQMLLLRLAETAVGAAGAVLAARLVLPVHTDEESDSKGADLLHAAGRLLAAAFEDGRRAPLYQPVRELDRKLQALRQALGPVTHADYPAVSKDDHRARLRRLSRIAYCVRHFYNLVASHAPALARAGEVQAAARTLAPALDAAAAQLAAPGAQAHGASPVPAQPGPGVAEMPPLDVPARPAAIDDPHQLRLARQWLAEASDILSRRA